MATTTTQTISVLGELFQQARRPCSLLRLIGGIQGAVRTTGSREFPTNVNYSLRNPSQSTALEGAAAPTATTTAVSQATNVIQIHQEAVGLTYLAQSDNTVTGVVPIPGGSVNGPVVNPRSEEFQTMAIMETIQRDVNYSFVQGTYANPANPTTTALKTRGLLTCITTNAIDVSADAISGTDPAKQYRGYVTRLCKAVMISNGYNPDLTWTLFGDATEFANCAAAFQALGTIFLLPETTVAGVQVRRIVTNVGTFNLALEPDMPAQTLMLADLGVVGPVGMPVPNKGIMFMEMLAKTGSFDPSQIYGQLGLDHGPEWCHGKIALPSFSLG